MKDRENNQYKRVPLPPPWCGAICRNAMGEVCIEHCAIKRDCSAFEPKPNLRLSDMPRFPETRNMTKEEKFTSVTVYLAAVVDELKGVQQNEPLRIRRPNLNRERCIEVLKNLKAENIQAHTEETDPTHQDRP